MESKVKKIKFLLGDSYYLISKWYRRNHELKGKYGEHLDKVSVNNLSEIWKKKIAKHFFSESIISSNKQAEIIKKLPLLINKLLVKRKRILSELTQQWKTIKDHEKQKKITAPSWFSLNTAFYENAKFRLQIGLKSAGCEYRENDPLKIGCMNCGFFVGNVYNNIPTEKQLISQFSQTINFVEECQKTGYFPDFEAIEFPNDGSFFNDNEIPHNVRVTLCKKLGAMNNVNVIMFETRPEHLSYQKIIDLKSKLRTDQIISIGIGLETTDPFISKFSINKGYSAYEFEEAVKALSSLSNIQIFAYSIIKPAFVNELEAIEDAIKTCLFIDSIQMKYQVQTYIKYEPAVVSDGTLLDVLYNSKNNGYIGYSPPSYWTVIEIIARLFFLGLEKKVRVGAREDMDLYQAIPALYYPNGMLSQVDFIMYDAIQQFNIHQDIRILLFNIKELFNEESFKEWKREIKQPIIEKLYLEKQEEINALARTNQFKRIKKKYNMLFKLLDEIEYGRKTQGYLINNIDKLEKSQWLHGVTNLITTIIQRKIKTAGVRVSDVQKLEDDLGLIRMKLEIFMPESDDFHSLWINIPTKRYVSLDDVACFNNSIKWKAMQ